MISAEFLNALEAMLREIKDVPAPWGGLRVVICGDFSQLVRPLVGPFFL